MKRKFFIILIICLVFSISGCSAISENEAHTEPKEKVAINQPTDNTVNGYRTEKSETNTDKTTLPETIGKDEIGIQSNPVSAQTQNSAGYCGNKNSKVFHNSSCGSVAKMKEENKVFAKNREEMISSGYKPCGSCKP